MRMNRKRNRKTHQSYQALEPRKMLAGNVRVAANAGAFYVRGDMEANQIEMTRSNDGTGSIRVTGIDGTTVNGQEEFVLQAQVTRGFRVNMGGGDDFVRIEDVNAGGLTVVYGAAGNDQVSIYDATLNRILIQTASGDDTVSIDEVMTNSNVRVATQDGNDTVGISMLRSFGGVIAATGEGDDSFVMKDSVIVRDDLRVFTSDGEDFVGTDSVRVKASSRIATGDGDDSVSVFNTDFLSDSVVSGQAGEGDLITVAGRERSEETLMVNQFEGDLMFPNGQTNQVFLGQVANGVRLGTIAELAVVNPDFSTLLGALQATGLDSAVADPEANLTVFAPLNSAFEDLPDGLLDGLTNEELTNILLFHVTEGSVFAEDLVQLDEVMTLLGESFDVEVGDDVVLNGNATLAATDIRAKNGVVHVLNDVLVPA